ncbi:winged helix-turn-helix domain-containing protein [Shewanella sp. NR704-98]|uniref:Winged helix-turn-helix domain-containing protein n=2 Tax=Shewanella nanhaiensis TaxID=2864872 RepID=A0ABS7E352_9GAMM|nr:winged helix-turn-helix domain-containing protein [Shewanella nanhaiensis]MBW8184080.1 winged helix-turn-helix domain-containing protein [Shewanella nanhaiensis]
MNRRLSETSIKISLSAIRLICILIKKHQLPISYDELKAHIWGETCVGNNSLPVTINEVRNLINSTNLKIINLRGFGYMMISGEENKHENSTINKIKEILLEKKIKRSELIMLNSLSSSDLNKIYNDCEKKMQNTSSSP